MIPLPLLARRLRQRRVVQLHPPLRPLLLRLPRSGSVVRPSLAGVLVGELDDDGQRNTHADLGPTSADPACGRLPRRRLCGGAWLFTKPEEAERGGEESAAAVHREPSDCT